MENRFDDENLEATSELNQSFAAAIENPQDFDFGFAQEREATGYANFGFDPETAAAMRNPPNGMEHDAVAEGYADDDE